MNVPVEALVKAHIEDTVEVITVWLTLTTPLANVSYILHLTEDNHNSPDSRFDA